MGHLQALLLLSSRSQRAQKSGEDGLDFIDPWPKLDRSIICPDTEGLVKRAGLIDTPKGAFAI